MNLRFPPALMTSDPGSYARLTILERKPTIITQVISDHRYSEMIIMNLNKLKDEIASLPIKPILEKSQDTTFWNVFVDMYSGKTWLELPWYFAEAYFYRKLLEATQYFQSGETYLQDPFLPGKLNALTSDIQWFEKVLRHFGEISSEKRFLSLFHSCLWGNRADLSNFTVTEQAQDSVHVHKQAKDILIDHSIIVANILSKGCKRVDWICDNIGKEELFDLAMVDFFLYHYHCEQVVLHLKDRPFFVSDAMIADTQKTIDLLQETSQEAAVSLGNRLRQHINSGRIRLISHPFYTTCLMYRQLPFDLHKELAASDLVILKGDVNYRRLIDDCHWPFTTPMEQITSYYPSPFVAIRTLKGEIMVDMAEGQAEAIAKEDPNWLIDGKKGVIRFVKPKKPRR